MIRYSQRALASLVAANGNHPSTDGLVAHLLGLPVQAVKGSSRQARALRAEIGKVREAMK